jgi:hypothetical protein
VTPVPQCRIGGSTIVRIGPSPCDQKPRGGGRVPGGATIACRMEPAAVASHYGIGYAPLNGPNGKTGRLPEPMQGMRLRLRPNASSLRRACCSPWLRDGWSLQTPTIRGRKADHGIRVIEADGLRPGSEEHQNGE